MMKLILAILIALGMERSELLRWSVIARAAYELNKKKDDK